MNLNRRNFLRGAAVGVAGTALAGGAASDLAGDAGAATPAASTQLASADRYSFYGLHQAGILSPVDKQAAATLASFNVLVTDRGNLTKLFQTLTERIRFLMTGGMPPLIGETQPPADSAVLGQLVVPDGLTVTVAVGSSLFDRRFGLAAQRPTKLIPMPIFANDVIDATKLHGDLSIQICANHADTVHHAIRDITKHTRGQMQLKWRMEGFASPPRPTGTSRNLLGFKDGTANPGVEDPAIADELIWVDADSDEPSWASGGSYQVVRLIRMLTEFWDRVSLDEQQEMFGRFRDSGAPLDGSSEFDVPDYAADPHGHVIPMSAHIRKANPRTAATADQRLFRRSYNYDLGDDSNGNLEVGHVFIAYNQDVERQFHNIQLRLADEPLVDYVQPFGGGYFFVLPGVANSSDYLGKSLLS